jgi:hypothetical protein
MVQGFFPVSKQEAETIVSGMPYDEIRRGVFRTKQALLETKEKHPLGFETHPMVIEVSVPENSARPYSDCEKFSFGACSGAIVANVCSIEVFEQKAVVALI